MSSSLDTLFNSVSSIVGTDLKKIIPEKENYINYAMKITPYICLIPAIFVVTQGYSVLYLFLIADMVCAAILFPVFFGLYTSHFNGRDSVISMIIGLFVGSVLFAKPDMSPLIKSIPYSGDLFVSFYMAFIASSLTALLLYLKNKKLFLK